MGMKLSGIAFAPFPMDDTAPGTELEIHIEIE
jgi:hypothetical protein